MFPNPSLGGLIQLESLNHWVDAEQILISFSIITNRSLDSVWIT